MEDKDKDKKPYEFGTVTECTFEDLMVENSNELDQYEVFALIPPPPI